MQYAPVTEPDQIVPERIYVITFIKIIDYAFVHVL